MSIAQKKKKIRIRITRVAVPQPRLQDMAGPVRDRLGPPPVRDMVGAVRDMAGAVRDMVGPVREILSPVRQSTRRAQHLPLVAWVLVLALVVTTPCSRSKLLSLTRSIV